MMIKSFRILGYIEGISLLILLGIAMPLKYIWEVPEMVKVVGMLHGILFIGYIVFLGVVAAELNWSWRKSVLAFFSSTLPFGVFIFDRFLMREMN